MSHTGSLTSEIFNTRGTEWYFEELLHAVVTVRRGTSIKCVGSSEGEKNFFFQSGQITNQEALMEDEN